MLATVCSLENQLEWKVAFIKGVPPYKSVCNRQHVQCAEHKTLFTVRSQTICVVLKLLLLYHMRKCVHCCRL